MNFSVDSCQAYGVLILLFPDLALTISTLKAVVASAAKDQPSAHVQ